MLLLRLALLICACYGVTLFCLKQTDGFSILRITAELPTSTDWKDTPLAEEQRREVEQALKQTYRYLGSGGQCFAFVSEDERYVLKLFLTPFHLLSAHSLQTLPIFPAKKRQAKTERALAKLRRDFTSYQIASEELRQETGVLYVHLDKSASFFTERLRLIDKLGIAHEIDLASHFFALQRKATLLYTHLEKLIEDGHLQEAKEAMRALIALCVARDRKGIADRDLKIKRNCGFIENRPLFIDIGRFERDATRTCEAVYLPDAKQLAETLSDWIQTHYPQHAPYFHEILS